VSAIAPQEPGGKDRGACRRAEKAAARLLRNALSLELLKEEQDRISSQEDSALAELSAAEADLDKWQEALSLAILSPCYRLEE
jgi:hypothetical protein